MTQGKNLLRKGFLSFVVPVVAEEVEKLE